MYSEILFEEVDEVDYTFSAWATVEDAYGNGRCSTYSKYINVPNHGNKPYDPSEDRARVIGSNDKVGSLTLRKFDSYFVETNTDVYENLYMSLIKDIKK